VSERPEAGGREVLSPARRALVDEWLRSGAARRPRTVPRRASGGPAPLSFAQERLWFINQLVPGVPIHNIAFAIRFDGPILVESLEHILGEIVRRHESLRTRFPLAGERPVQVVDPPRPPAVTVVEVTAGPSEVERLVAEESRWLFDLERGPLLRATLLRLDDLDHVLIVTMHHIIADAWSVAVFNRELSAVAGAYVAGRTAPLVDLPVQYSDFAAWQRGWAGGREGARLEAELAYWRERLRDLPDDLALPTDRPRRPVVSYAGGRHHLAISPALTGELRSVCRREGVTLYMLLLAVLDVLLHRYTGSADVAVGSPVSGRHWPEVEDVIGLFLNTLVMRTDLSGDPPFRELLRRVRDLTGEAYANQLLPFERLVDELRPVRDLSRMPLVQVVFNLRNDEGELVQRYGPLTTTGRPKLPTGTCQFDLTFDLVDGRDGLTGFVEYARDLYDAATVERMAQHYERLLRAVVAEPEARLSALPMLGAEERRRLLEPGGPEPAPVPFHRLFAERAAEHPDAIAVSAGWPVGEVPYGELDRRSRRLARRLRRLGVGPDVLVALVLPRSLDQVVALLGVLMAGGAYLPLDPGAPPERLAQVLAEARPALVLTGVPEVPPPTETEGEAEEDTPVHPDNLAYVLYTSGSTGQPKGVAVTHRGLATYLAWSAAAYGPLAGEASPVHTPLVFDLSVTSLLLPLAAGGRVELVPEDAGPEGLAGALRERRGWGLVKLTPAHVEALELQLTAAEMAGRSRLLVIGGENLTAERVEAWRRAAPGTAIVNEYGPTEAVVGCCTYRLADGEDLDGESVPIGRPAPGTRVHVLGPRRELVPAGVPGELYVGGAQLARGYLGRPDLTAERFVPDPYGPAGARLYRTGDLVRRLACGQLEYLGRLDDQVKVRGYRVEPGEVEAALRRVPGVRDAAVVAREVAGERQLVAHLVAEPGGRPDDDDVRGDLRSRLPDYMVPPVLAWHDALPLTPNGKVDRRALARPDAGPAAGDDGPRTPLEEVLAAIWADVLGVERVGVDDNFFLIGGQSMLAFELVTRVRDLLDVEVSLRGFFEAPTVAAHARALGADEAVAKQLPRIAELVHHLAAMSAGEVDALLAADRGERC
jgi:amino acid adenylation domain-containing protein